jgi:N-acetylglucosamine-6-phosphate deacetylase
MRRLLALLLIGSFAVADPTTTAPPRGLRENTPRLHAFVNARVVVSPTQTLDRATVVVRDGVIIAVGAETAAPADARVHDLAGKTIYPGLIDAYSEPTGVGGGRGGAAGAPAATPPTALNNTDGGAAHWNREVLAAAQVDRTFKPDAAMNKSLRSQGFVARLAVPSAGLVKGTSALVSTSDDDATRAIIKPIVAQHLALTPARRGFGPRADGDAPRYPTSPMGAYTLVRQTLLDARWYSDAWAAHRANRQLPAPQRNDALDALAAQLDNKLPFIIDANDELYVLRAAQIANEMKIPVIVRGSGQEYRRLDEIVATKLPLIIPLSFPRPPNVNSPEYALNVSLTDLMDWDLAPENPARLHKAGVSFAISTHGLRDKSDFLKQLRKAVQRGLDRSAALAAVTTTPAKLLGVDDSLGTIEPGKRGSFIVADGDLFEEKTKIVQMWADGNEFEIVPKLETDPRGQWSFASNDGEISFKLNISGEPGRLRGEIVKADQPRAATTEASTSPTTRPTRGERGSRDASVKQFAVDDTRVSFNLAGEAIKQTGIAQVSGTFDVAGDNFDGRLLESTGLISILTGKRESKTVTTRPDDDSATKPSTQPANALFAVNYPLGDFGHETLPAQPAIAIFKNATVWTCAADGTLEQTDVRVESGRITAIGKRLTVPDGATVIDCEGKHLAPGIIDCHSHMATDGGVNEGGQAVTAEVRIGDFIDPDDISIYRQLASGITAANILHGSANAIGGQNQVIKLRWGVNPEQLKFESAPAGIKFALGENPRGANGNVPDNGGEYPQTRMGVEQLIRNTFNAARDYRAAQKRFAADGQSSLPVHPDLELEAVAEILEGKRLIHCHSYRQDEILALIRICDEFGVKIATLQHILEGYKVADAIAKHGAGASSFSDWWAYKLEVWDAIPHNGAIMFGQGVNVSFNSDDAEMARRLNSEAAKATKYGNVPPAEALKFVTINPAKQLKVDNRTGSIEVGKDADLAIWNTTPMSMYAVCQQTWVDGRKYFDRDEDAELRNRDRDMRRKLIQKILSSGEPVASDADTPPRERELWPRYDEYCTHGRALNR